MRDDVARSLAARALEVAKTSKSQRGEKGEKGDPGQIVLTNVPVPGEQGPKGERGPQGIQGPRGYEGPKGDRGDAGPKGADGTKGDKGDKGEKGEKGDRGERGLTGAKGSQGDQGIPGPYLKHESKGLMLRFEKEPGVWDRWIVIPTGGGGGGGRDDKLTDRQKELVALAEVYRQQGSNAGKYLKTDGTNVSWETVSGGGGGTVTSVAMTVPTGLSVSGSPVTSDGTLAVSYASGYAIPTTAKQTNWDTAFGWGNHASVGYLTSAAIGVTVQAYDSDLTSWAAIAPSSKQDTLVSGTNIKTINGTSVLGSGDISISGGGVTIDDVLALSIALG